MKKSVTVITPTTGSPKLTDALISVAKQKSNLDITHLIVGDGPEYMAKVSQLILRSHKNNEIDLDSVRMVFTPINTGANGFNGQRIYAAYPHLVNTDYVAFLDQDNWYAENHVQTLVDTIEENNLDWSYSLRDIYSEDRQFLISDHCESLGAWPIFFTYNTESPQFLIDTSCFLFKRGFIQKTAHLWHSGAWGEDRRYLQAVRQLSNWRTTGLSTLCYRLNGNPNSVNVDLFIQGNNFYQTVYGHSNNFPWVKKNDRFLQSII